MGSESESNYSDNSDFLLSDISDESSLLDEGFIEKYMDKEIFILDYDDTIKLHSLCREKQQRYEERLYKVLNTLKTLYNKKIYIISYHLGPRFTKKYKELIEEIYLPVSLDNSEFKALQKELFCGYTVVSGKFYRYIPKHIHIKEIANKNNVDISKIVFFDDNVQNISQAKKHGIESVLVDKYFGIEI